MGDVRPPCQAAVFQPAARRQRLTALDDIQQPAGPDNGQEAVRQAYATTTPNSPHEWTDQLSADLQDVSCPPEIRQLGRTLRRWTKQIVAWHTARVTNGPTESMNNLIKRTKRAAFGMTNFRNWRIRVLLYAGRPDWSRLATVTP